jgi:hypothetical protein
MQYFRFYISTCVVGVGDTISSNTIHVQMANILTFVQSDTYIAILFIGCVSRSTEKNVHNIGWISIFTFTDSEEWIK